MSPLFCCNCYPHTATSRSRQIMIRLHAAILSLWMWKTPVFTNFIHSEPVAATKLAADQPAVMHWVLAGWLAGPSGCN